MSASDAFWLLLLIGYQVWSWRDLGGWRRMSRRARVGMILTVINYGEWLPLPGPVRFAFYVVGLLGLVLLASSHNDDDDGSGGKKWRIVIHIRRPNFKAWGIPARRPVPA